MNEQDDRLARAREEIAARVASFKATQEKFEREREEYYATTLGKAWSGFNRPSFWTLAPKSDQQKARGDAPGFFVAESPPPGGTGKPFPPKNFRNGGNESLRMRVLVQVQQPCQR